MSDKPVIFISYSHKDEPDQFLQPGEFRWLTYVRSFLDPAAAHGQIELWDDRQIDGGGDWKVDIDQALERCAVCVFLVSRHSLSSRFILDVEMKRMLERHHARGARLYPILITSADLGVAPWLLKLNLKPTNATALELYESGPRNKVMSELAGEIRLIIERAAARSTREIGSSTLASLPKHIDTEHLPLTPYQKLVGRDDELRTLDGVWDNSTTNIVSLIAWGGAGKTALVNEWLRRLRGGNYRGANAVLGWSFYDQGTKERTTSADQFLDWALEKLGVVVAAPNAVVKAERLAEVFARQRILLVLDGVEPLQHGPGTQEGELKDQGLRVFLRRFATTPPAGAHGLVVITSRLPIRDIDQYAQTTNWDSSKVIDLASLSDDAGAAMLRDNGVLGAEKDLRSASREFDGHALALSLLASFLVRRHQGDIRRRDRVGPLTQKSKAPGHDHARRVMDAYEQEWLRHEPVLISILYLVSLFDRPASNECLAALRAEPAIPGLTEPLSSISYEEWLDAIALLRHVRLLDPADPTDLGALDTHPLIRDWFAERLLDVNEAAWRAAHGRLYDFLRDSTKEGKKPTLRDLSPLYQATSHGCRAGRHQEVLESVYKRRISRLHSDGAGEHYPFLSLGAGNTELAGISSFFDRPFEVPNSGLSLENRFWVLAAAGFFLRGQGRLNEATQVLRLALAPANKNMTMMTQCAADLTECLIVLGEIESARRSAILCADLGKKKR